MKFVLKTLTPIWTGGMDGTLSQLRETGIIGSLRWWYEAVVRGLGGYACDPTDDSRCPDKKEHRCGVCNLFGCTDWSRKFRIRILNEQNDLIQEALEPNQIFTIDLIELKPITKEEKWLLIKTLTQRLVSVKN
jgi:CRISPR-associated protein Cmr1